MKNIVLFGPPGVGKGTQGVRLSEEFGIAHLAMGDILRAAVADGTGAGIKAKTFMDQGKLVPDEVVVAMIEDRAASTDAAHGFLLDGFPRNVAQAEALAAMLEKHGWKLDHIVCMDASRDALLTRLSGRLVCRACGFGFHRHYSPPRKEGCCDRCGGELYQRADDCADVIAHRLDVYDEQTRPLLAYYADADGFQRMDAGGEMAQVYMGLKALMSNG